LAAKRRCGGIEGGAGKGIEGWVVLVWRRKQDSVAAATMVFLTVDGKRSTRFRLGFCATSCVYSTRTRWWRT
jgi:hypothetical protein